MKLFINKCIVLKEKSSCLLTNDFIKYVTAVRNENVSSLVRVWLGAEQSPRYYVNQCFFIEACMHHQAKMRLSQKLESMSGQYRYWTIRFQGLLQCHGVLEEGHKCLCCLPGFVLLIIDNKPRSIVSRRVNVRLTRRRSAPNNTSNEPHYMWQRLIKQMCRHTHTRTHAHKNICIYS